MRPEFVDWEILTTKRGFKRMHRVRLWCMSWLQLVVLLTLTSGALGVLLWMIWRLA